MKLCEFDYQNLKPNSTMHLTQTASDTVLSIRQIDKIIEFIKINCSEFLLATNKAGKFLHRGMLSGDHNYQSAFIGNPRNDRRSMAIDSLTVKKLNKCFAELGSKCNRNSCLCCNSDTRLAKQYGDLYSIFPINGYSFSWSPSLFDWGGNYNQGDFNFLKTNYKLEDISKYTASEIFEELNICTSNMPAALNSGNEIAINGHYVAIEYSSNNLDLLSRLVPNQKL